MTSQSAGTKSGSKKSLVVIVIMVALVLVLVAGALSAKFAPSSASNPSTTVSCGPYAAASPQSVLYQFQSNQATANSQWQGKTICFRDYVGSVDQVGSGQYASCIYYTSSGYQYGCNSPGYFNGWVIYNWASSQAAAAIPTHGVEFTATCSVTAYQAYGQFAFAGYGKSLILDDCQLYG